MITKRTLSENVQVVVLTLAIHDLAIYCLLMLCQCAAPCNFQHYCKWQLFCFYLFCLCMSLSFTSCSRTKLLTKYARILQVPTGFVFMTTCCAHFICLLKALTMGTANYVVFFCSRKCQINSRSTVSGTLRF